MGKTEIKTGANILLIVLFCSFLCSSAMVMISSDKSVSSENENRRLAILPPIPRSTGQLRGFFKGLDDYFNDHFGFREHYIHRYHRELQKRFNISTPLGRVIQGLDGWFFYNKFNLLADFFGMIPPAGKYAGRLVYRPQTTAKVVRKSRNLLPLYADSKQAVDLPGTGDGRGED